jgi:hypothetical protein
MLVGAWRRSGLLFDGARSVDFCDVVWLQTPEWFADVRLLIDTKAVLPTEGLPARFAKEVCFAGIGIWEAPLMTWEHRFDTRPVMPADANPLTGEDGVMAEKGTISDGGRDVPFVEEWLRMTDDDVSWSVTDLTGGVRVEVGRWAVEIAEVQPGGPSRATRYDKVGEAWTPVGSVGG